jgi:hypothetical protein
VNGSEALAQFLATDPADVGCEAAMDVLHVYVEWVARGDNLDHTRYAGVQKHLAACGPCAEDFHGLLATVIGATGGGS